MMFLHCQLCGENCPAGVSMEEYARLSVAIEPVAQDVGVGTLTVVCSRHNLTLYTTPVDLRPEMTKCSDCGEANHGTHGRN